MRELYSFRVLTFSSGKKLLQAHIFNESYSLLESFSSFFHSIGELRWIRDEIAKEYKKEDRSETGQNTFKIIADGEMMELSHTYNLDFVNYVPANILFQFLDDSIAFLDLYHSGGIPGIIPESKENNWVIVPKEFVKEEYWKKSDSKD